MFADVNIYHARNMFKYQLNSFKIIWMNSWLYMGMKFMNVLLLKIKLEKYSNKFKFAINSYIKENVIYSVKEFCSW